MTSGHEALHRDTGFQGAVREGDWKLQHGEPGDVVDHLHRFEHAEVLTGMLLTNLRTDVAGTADVRDERPDVVRRLTERHAAWRGQVGLG